MIELRNVIPNRVTNPTIEPIVRTPPVANTASTPPTSAKGIFARIKIRLRRLPVTIASRSRMPVVAKADWAMRLRRASACASAEPAYWM